MDVVNVKQSVTISLSNLYAVSWPLELSYQLQYEIEYELLRFVAL